MTAIVTIVSLTVGLIIAYAVRTDGRGPMPVSMWIGLIVLWPMALAYLLEQKSNENYRQTPTHR
jgi:hypothetical protein